MILKARSKRFKTKFMDDIQGKPKKSLKPLIALNVVLATVLIGILVFLFKGYETTYPPASDIPAFGMANALNEDSFGSADLKGEVFILNIFASWCKPCEAEHPYLTKISEKYDVPLYGIAFQNKPEDVQAFLERLGNPYTAVGLDSAGLMLKGLGIEGLPSTIVADENMKIHMIWQGPLTKKVVREKIMPLIDNIRVGEGT